MSSRCEVRVDGHLDERWAAVLDGFDLRHDADGTTTLTGLVVDQAHLHGLLARLRDLSVPLLSMQAAPAPEPPAQLKQPLASLTWPRPTDRLVLRPATSDDAEGTWRYRRLETVSRWLTEVPASLEAYRLTFEQPDRLATTIVATLDGRIVADLMLRVEDAWAQTEVAHVAHRTQAEIAWVLDPDVTGQGYATEAARELLTICFDDLGLRRVTATCFADNVPSWRLMERIGMRRESHAVQDALHRTGRWMDTFIYAALPRDWSPRSDHPEV
ncbi:GNAT family N-acetyltransferase [Pedococcus sp. 5OH_020]|uniref:GNAT family N-acetyltransferase n=1 Tax=Pedococcus sp. 5OH_020 TaxID=2989814 RepID=UPI0022E9EBDF|nr:GNAT family protein [Pedococcus sp. 5OH_020]